MQAAFLRIEPRLNPLLAGLHVLPAFVPAIVSMRPEFKRLRQQFEAAPVCWTRDVPGRDSFQFSQAFEKLPFVRHHAALRRSSSSNPAEIRTLLKVRVGFFCRKPLDRTFDANLFSEMRPMERHRRKWVFRQFAT